MFRRGGDVMTIRTSVSSEGQPSEVTVHAGPADELAALALEYAAGKHGRLVDALPCHFEAVAARLLDGAMADSAGSVEFWRDYADGSPLRGNPAYRPDPDPVWAAGHRSTGDAVVLQDPGSEP